MILSITTTHYPATDLGFLLHKHPDKLQTVELSMGEAHIFYTEKTDQKTTANLLLDIDSTEVARNHKNPNKDFSLGQYVNDRPYIASSLMSVAVAKAFSSALNGNCKNKPELVTTKMPFEVCIVVISAPKGGENLIRKLFEPLGYQVEIKRYILDENFEEWGNSKYYTLNLQHNITLQELLSHLYVLMPALDNDKHYFVSHHEIEKLLEKGEKWLKNHPHKEEIISRYLINLHDLTKQALQKLNGNEEIIASPITETNSEIRIKKETLHQKRLNKVADEVLKLGAKKVLDLGCGEGKLIKILLKEKQITQITGMDVVYDELLKAKKNLHLDELPLDQQRITLIQGSLMYQDARLEGFDVATLVEVIEHLEPNRLFAFEKVVFECAKPKNVIVTTPNQEYNVMWKQLDADTMRHDDHRFEWTRQEFQHWATNIAKKYDYQVDFSAIGEEVENIGSPSQMAVFQMLNYK